MYCLVLQVWHADDRARIEAYTHWGIIGFAGLLVRTYVAKFPHSHYITHVIDRLDAEHWCCFAGADCAVEQFCFHAGAACHPRGDAGSGSVCSQ